jgi:hypothetical protein
MYFVNHVNKIVIFWFHKCGHTSLINFFEKIPNFEFYEAWNKLDSYTFIEKEKTELLAYNKCMIVRNPVHYSISGYKHFLELYNKNRQWKMFFEKIFFDRFNTVEYTFELHLEMLLCNEMLFNHNINFSKDFHTHCCRQQRYTYRPDVKIIKLEELHELYLFLNSNDVFTETVFPHSNKRDNVKINITDNVIRMWKHLYEKDCEILGYDLDNTIKTIDENISR